jgi:hypothetical protein
MLAVVAFFAPGADAVSAAWGRTVSTAGGSVQIPAGWQAQSAKTPSCDPERRIVASSAPTRIRAGGGLSSPPAGGVLVLLLEDRYRQDRPVGKLHRPRHFAVTWNQLTQIKPSCGLPSTPAYTRYFKTHGRYLGFIVYPGTAVGTATREATLKLMDSLRIKP